MSKIKARHIELDPSTLQDDNGALQQVPGTDSSAQTLQDYGVQSLFGDGSDGYFWLGPIVDPVVSNVATVTGISGGELTATVGYRYRKYNMSGHSSPTNMSVSVSLTNQTPRITIPAQASSTNTTGYKLERTIDGGTTWFHTMTIPVADVTVPTTVLDYSLRISGTNLGASNTATNASDFSTTAGYSILRVTGGFISSSQSVTKSNGNMLVYSLSDFEIQLGATINMPNHGFAIPSFSTFNRVGTYPSGGVGGGAGAFDSSKIFTALFSRELIQVCDHAFMLVAKGHVKAKGTWNLQGGAVGKAGGLVAIISPKSVDKTGAVFNVPGGPNSVPGHGAGGGGIIFIGTDLLVGSSTNNVAGGIRDNGGNGNSSGGDGLGGQGGNGNGLGGGGGQGDAGNPGYEVNRSFKETVIPIL